MMMSFKLPLRLACRRCVPVEQHARQGWCPRGLFFVWVRAIWGVGGSRSRAEDAGGQPLLCSPLVHCTTWCRVAGFGQEHKCCSHQHLSSSPYDCIDKGH